MGAMAVTLAQTLGQNLGMMWNKHRSSAGINEDPRWPTTSPDPHPAALEVKRVSMGLGRPSTSPYIHLTHLSGDCKCPDNWLGCIMEDTG